MAYQRKLSAVVDLACFVVAIGWAVPVLAADVYKIDRNHTEIRFSYNHMALTNQSGRFLNYEGSLTFDEAEPEASVLEVTIEAASLTTDVAALDKRLRSAEFFDVEKHPKITFKSTTVVRTGAKTGQVTGDLTIKGVSKSVVLDVDFNFAGDHPLAPALKKYKDTKAVAFSARTQVLRSDFGVAKFAPLTSDTVAITIETELLKRP